jgi:hypothetical protein
MLPTIDLLEKGQEIRIQICNSRMQVIGNVKEADSKAYDINTGKLNELSFTIPLYIDNLQTGIQKNKNADLLVNRCILKVKYGSLEEYFIIDSHDDSDDNQYRSIHAFSLGNQLNDKIIRYYKSQSTTPTDYAVPISIQTAITDALQLNRSWTVGYIDPAFTGIYRTFEFDSQTGLEYIYQIGTAFNAIITWDTKNKKVSAYHPDFYGTDKGFKITDEKYISSLVKKTSDDEFCTRLYLYGKDGITINTVSPLGVSYIEDFSYFMNNGMMSQDLVNALVSYNNYVIFRQGEFPTLLTQLTTKQDEMSTLQLDMSTLQNNKTIIQDRLDGISAINERTNIKYSLTSTVTSGTTTFTDVTPVKRLFFFKITTSETPTITHNGVSVPSTSNNLYMLKLDNVTTSTLTLTGFTNPITIDGYYIIISNTDFALTNTELEDKFGIDKINSLIDSKQTAINTKQSELNSVTTSMNQLKTDLSIETHLTVDELNELDNFIIEKEYSDDNLIDANSLLEAGKKQLAERNIPQVLHDVSLINFLNCLEEKRNWDKVSIFDIVRIQSKKLDVDIKARIINIRVDQDTIGLTIANSKNVKDEPNKFIQLLYGTASGTKQLQRKEGTWDDASKVRTEFNDYLNSAIDAVKQKIVAGVNETIQITERGIKVTSPDDINTFLIINHGVIAITRDGGSTWENALTTSGLIAERVIGKLLIGSKLTISNENGTFAVDGGNVTINGGSTKAKILINPTDGIKIQTSPDNGTTWVDTFYVDTNGILHAKGLVITNDDGTAVLIDAKNKTIDFSKFTSIFGTLLADIIQGGTLKLGGLNNGNGSLQVLNGSGEIIANLDSAQGGFDKLWVGNFSSPTVPNLNNNTINLYVDAINGNDSNTGSDFTNAKKSLSGAVDEIPQVNNGTVNIYLHYDNCKDIQLNVKMAGISGNGTINIIGQNTQNTVHGIIQVQSCTNIVNFTDLSIASSTTCLEVDRSPYVTATRVWALGDNSTGGTAGFKAFNSGYLYLKDSYSYYSQFGVYASHNGTVFVQNTGGKGSVRGIVAQYGGTIKLFGDKYPTGGTSDTYNDTAGQIIGTGAVDTTSTNTTQTATATTTTTQWVSNVADNWSTSYSSWQGGGAKQGDYGYGQRKGFWWFESSPIALSGKTIKSMRVWVQRASSGGNSGTVRIYLHPHTYATKATVTGTPTLSLESDFSVYVDLAWGKGAWVTIPTSWFANFANGTYKGIGVWAGSTNSNYYSIMNGQATLEATYQ